MTFLPTTAPSPHPSCTRTSMKTRSAHALPHVSVSSSAEPFLLHSQLFSLPLWPPPLSALASFSIHRAPLSLGPGHMQEGRLGRCSSEKMRGKTLCCYFYRRALPFSWSVPKEGGIFYYSQSQNFNPLPALTSLCKICSSVSCNKWFCFAPALTSLRHLRRHFSGPPRSSLSRHLSRAFGQFLLLLVCCQ